MVIELMLQSKNKRVMVRITDDMHDLIGRRAVANFRTYGEEFVYLVTKAIETDPVLLVNGTHGKPGPQVSAERRRGERRSA
jgi:hypothetical protein